MKKETLEEAAERLYCTIPFGFGSFNPNNKFKKLDFITGVKWQQERSYSEEDMMFAYEQGAKLAMISQSNLALHKGEFPNPKQWFEQFKKK